MIVDAHHHMWRIGQNGHEWPTPELSPIYRDFDAEDLMAAAREADLTGTVLVQSQPNDADTGWMLDTAADTLLIQGVVGWTDLAAPDAPAAVAALARRPKLKGLRPMLQGLSDDAWILRDEVRPALAAICDHGLSFDALVFTRHLAAIDRLAEAFPALAIVVDHGAKPPIATSTGLDTTWAEAVSRLSRHENVYCKLSGVLTEMREDQPHDAMRPYADHLYACFGADRLMWGSDWPVVNLRATWQDWYDWTRTWLADKPAADQCAILGRTAQQFYRIGT